MTSGIHTKFIDHKNVQGRGDQSPLFVLQISYPYNNGLEPLVPSQPRDGRDGATEWAILSHSDYRITFVIRTKQLGSKCSQCRLSDKKSLDVENVNEPLYKEREKVLKSGLVSLKRKMKNFFYLTLSSRSTLVSLLFRRIAAKCK